MADEYNKGVNLLREYSKVVPLDSDAYRLIGRKQMHRVFYYWLTTICNQANKNASNVTTVEISVERLPVELVNFCSNMRFSYYSEEPEKFSEGSDEWIAKWIIDNFNFNLLLDSIKDLENDIQSIGLAESATSLISSFGLSNAYFNNELKIVPQKKDRYFLKVGYYGSHYYARHGAGECLRDLLGPALSFEGESGVLGFSECIKQALKEVDLISRLDLPNPKRVNISHGRPVSAVFFKEHVRFVFSSEVFKELVRFIKAYGRDIHGRGLIIDQMFIDEEVAA